MAGRRARPWHALAAAGLALAAAGARPAGAAPGDGITAAESRCQLGAVAAARTFIDEASACIVGCSRREARARRSTGECLPPYGGGTRACLERAGQKARAIEMRKCAGACPDCYGGTADCGGDATTRVATLLAQIDVLVQAVYCDDTASGDGLNAAEAACRDTVAGALGTFGSKLLRCYARCRKAEFEGRLPAGACRPPAADAPTRGCVTTAGAVAAHAIDRKCRALRGRGDRPECYGAAHGGTWVGLVEVANGAADPNFYCASPSAAFLDAR